MYRIEFTPEELRLLEFLLKKKIEPNNITNTVTILFGQKEMENMEKILSNEIHKNLNNWFDLLQEERNKRSLINKLLNKCIKPTEEMRHLWKYTGKIEELYDKIAAPIGKSKRIKVNELEKYI